MSNKRRHAQAFPLAATLIGVAIAVCISVFAIKALTVKYQVIQGGNKLKQLEKRLAGLSVQIEDLQTKKHVLSSPPNLQKAQDNGSLKLVKIEEKYVIRVGGELKTPELPALPATKPIAEAKR